MPYQYQIGDWAQLNPEAREIVQETFKEDPDLLQIFLRRMKIVKLHLGAGNEGAVFEYPRDVTLKIDGQRQLWKSAGEEFFWQFEYLEVADSECHCEIKLLMSRGCQCGNFNIQ